MKENEVEILLRDMQEYRELTDRVKAIYGDQMTLKDMVDVMERIIREPGRKDPVNARILTYDEAAMWDEYRKIGTPEEYREAMERQKPEKPIKKWGAFGNPEEKDLDRLTSMHHKILDTKFAEIVTEQEMIAFLRAKDAVSKQIRKPVKNLYGTSYIWKAGYCPVCGCGVTARWDYCQCCGQKLEWEEDYEN